MKKFLILFITIFLILPVVRSGCVISKFEADPGYNKVTLKWTTTTESNLAKFEIHRSNDNQNFSGVGEVQAKGTSKSIKEYTFEDKTVFKTNDNIYYYKLKIIESDGTSGFFNEVVEVRPRISSVRHTWGSIKAMFR